MCTEVAPVFTKLLAIPASCPGSWDLKQSKVSEWLNTRFCRGERSASEQGFGHRKSVDWFLIREKGTFWQPLSHYQQALSHFQEAVQDRKTFNAAPPSVIICWSCINQFFRWNYYLTSKLMTSFTYTDMNHLLNRWNRKTRERWWESFEHFGEAWGAWNVWTCERFHQRSISIISVAGNKMTNFWRL